MQIPVMIEPLPNGRGFAAHLAAPLALSAEASTPEEAERLLAALVQARLQEGMEVHALNLPITGTRGSQPGWLPDDDLTREWLQEVQAYRDQCDQADRARLGAPPMEEPAS